VHQSIEDHQAYIHKLEEQLGAAQREMRNREDSYNRRFARDPNVAVMQVSHDGMGWDGMGWDGMG
jgi:hypothetical protein